MNVINIANPIKVLILVAAIKVMIMLMIAVIEHCSSYWQKWLQVLVLLSPGYWHGRYDKRLPAVGQ